MALNGIKTGKIIIDDVLHITDFEVVGEKFYQLGTQAVDLKMELEVTDDGLKLFKRWGRQLKRQNEKRLRNKRRRKRGRSL